MSRYQLVEYGGDEDAGGCLGSVIVIGLLVTAAIVGRVAGRRRR